MKDYSRLSDVKWNEKQKAKAQILRCKALESIAWNEYIEMGIVNISGIPDSSEEVKSENIKEIAKTLLRKLGMTWVQEESLKKLNLDFLQIELSITDLNAVLNRWKSRGYIRVKRSNSKIEFVFTMIGSWKAKNEIIKNTTKNAIKRHGIIMHEHVA